MSINSDEKLASPRNQSGLVNFFQRISHKMLSALEKGSIIGTVLLFIMMLLTVVDVVGRYFLKTPVQGAYEATGLLLVCVAACALYFSQIKKGHIRVDLLTGYLSQTARNVLDVIAYFICLFASALIAWQTLARAISYMSATRGNLTETLMVPFYPFLLVLGIGFVCLALVALVDFIQSMNRLLRK